MGAWASSATGKERQTCYLHGHCRNVCESSEVAADTHWVDNVLRQAEWHPLWHSQRLTLVEEASEVDVDAVARRGIKQDVLRVPGVSFKSRVMHLLATS